MCNASVIHCKKGTFIHILCKELKRLGLQSYVALKRPLISEAKQKKGFNLIGSVNIGLYTSRKKVTWSNEPSFTLFQGNRNIRVRNETYHEPIMHSAYFTNLWMQCYDLRLLHAPRKKNRSDDYLNMLSDFSMNSFLSSLIVRLYPESYTLSF